MISYWYYITCMRIEIREFSGVVKCCISENHGVVEITEAIISVGRWGDYWWEKKHGKIAKSQVLLNIFYEVSQ